MHKKYTSILDWREEDIRYIEKKLNFPVVIKPINEGSSVNVFICNKNEIHKKLVRLKSYKQETPSSTSGGSSGGSSGGGSYS